MNIIDVTPENVDETGFFCLMSRRKSDGYQRKLKWLHQRFEEGLRIKMIDSDRGVVVNMSSGWGRSTSPEVAPYCASKFAVEGLTLALSQELPPGLAVVAVSPGVVDTDMLRSCWGDSAAASPSPEAWAIGATDFLLSLNTGHNGESLSV